MSKAIKTLSWLTLFGCACGITGLIATTIGSHTIRAEYIGVHSQTKEGFATISVTIIWLLLLSMSNLYLLKKTPKNK